MIEPAASYSFNKSHSVCYSLIAYQTGYLKAHYPIEFYAALLRSHENNTDRLSLLIDETRAHGIQVAVPDVNNAFPHVSAIDTIIYL
jgi:DNA polymerase-3 subunit alpha